MARAMLAGLMHTFTERTRHPEDKRKAVTMVKFFVALAALSAISFLILVAKPTAEGTRRYLVYVRTLTPAAISAMALVIMYLKGITLAFKVIFPILFFMWVLFASVCFSKDVPYHLWGIVILDVQLVLQTQEDQAILSKVSYSLLVVWLIYISMHVLSAEGLGGPDADIFFRGEADGLTINLICNLAPAALNYLLLMPYVTSARMEARRTRDSAKAASEVARALANFDLDGASRLMAQGADSVAGSPIHRPLEQLVRNLRSYRPFLPNYLFQSTPDGDPTDGIIEQAMRGATTSWGHVASAVGRMRDLDYSLHAFHADVEAAFPELRLYTLEAEAETGCSSGLTGAEECQRTYGALYSAYCIARLDLDGREIFSFGVDEQGRPVSEPAGEGAEKKRGFYESMDWGQMQDLFVRAGLLREAQKVACTPKGAGTAKSWSAGSTSVDMGTCPVGDFREIRVDENRMTAFLVLTAIHDVMKNKALTPAVQRRHAPYHGFVEDSPISDHDLALTYLMEHFSGLLPSFNGMEPSQRLPVFFSQGKVEFNNGWLVQGEAPPGALFSTLKNVITLGGASQADISFYFAHWLTDLAGAEPFGTRPWPGSEKFVTKFPRHVLVAFLDSFAYIDHLAFASEVQVMEQYLRHRWSALGLPSEPLSEGSSVASMRVALMAQGFEAGAVAALRHLPPLDLEVLASEMSRTGLRAQFEGAPADVSAAPAGPAVLVYYAPALIQKAGAEGASGALRILAAVYRAARKLFPLETSSHAVERTVTIRIEALKVLTPPEIVAAGSWLLRRYSDGYAVAERACSADAATATGAADVALIDLPADKEVTCCGIADV